MVLSVVVPLKTVVVATVVVGVGVVIAVMGTAEGEITPGISAMMSSWLASGLQRKVKAMFCFSLKGATLWLSFGSRIATQ